MLNQQYDRSAGLEDQFLNRDLQNQQYTKTGAQNAWEAMAGRGSGAYQNERNRQMGAIPLGQNEQNLAYQRIGGVQNAGNFLQGQQQQGLDFGYQNWQDQQNFPYKQVDWLASLLSRAQGGNPMNSSMYSGGGSQYAPYVGAGIAGLSLLP